MAFLTLLFSFVLTLPIFGMKFGVRRSPAEWTDLAALCSLNFSMVLLSTWNLIQDVERGYSPSKCSLAAVLLLFASGPPLAAGFGVLRYVF